jgi:hypothetical protein
MGNRIGTPRAVVFGLFYFFIKYIVTNIYFTTIFLSYVDLILKNANAKPPLSNEI